MLTPDKARAVCDAYLAGRPVREIYDTHSIWPWELYALIDKHGLPRRKKTPARYRRTREERNKEIAEAVAAGVDVGELVAKHNITRGRVWQIVRTGR